MSRLDSAIRRLTAQRDCLNFVADQVRCQAGLVIELGLGNGRTYDHLRTLFTDRRILVLDRHVAAHPDCIPPDHDLILGDFRQSLPALAKTQPEQAIVIHIDVGSGNSAASRALAAELCDDLVILLMPGGFIISDQPLAHPALEAIPLPAGVAEGRYFIHRKWLAA